LDGLTVSTEMSKRSVHPGWLLSDHTIAEAVQDQEDELRFDAFMQLLRTAGALDRAATDALADLDLTAGAFGALVELGAVGVEGIAPSELARRLAVARRTATLYVDILARHGWAHREAHPADRRMVLARLTPAGEMLLGDLGEAYKRRLAQLLGDISPLQAERLRQLRHRPRSTPLGDRVSKHSLMTMARRNHAPGHCHVLAGAAPTRHVPSAPGRSCPVP
jgi:DNA-binding MarR family transcriptional regulator